MDKHHMQNPSKLLNFRFGLPRAMPVIQQSEATECGLACVAMVASFHGHKTDIASLRKIYKTSHNGMTLIDVMAVCENLKLVSRPLRMEISALQQFTQPAILHWDMNHFVVLKKATSKMVVIHDPAYGVKQLSYEEASRHFTGIALEIYPTKEFIPKKTKTVMKLGDFWGSLTGLKRSLLKILLLTLVLQIFALASPYYMKLVVDEAVVSSSEQLLYTLALGFGLLTLFSTTIKSIRSLITMHFTNQLSIQIGANLFHHLIRLPLEFFEKRHIGDVVSRFGATEQIKGLLTTGLIETLLDGVMAITTGVMIFIISPALAFIAVGVLITHLIIRLIFYKPERRLSEEAIVLGANQSTNFMETIRAIQSIKIFCREEQRQNLWLNKFADSLNTGIKMGNLGIFSNIINSILFGIENLVIVTVAGLMVINSELTIGTLFAFMAYKGQFSGKIDGLIAKIIQFKMLGLHLERLSEITLAAKEKNLTVDEAPIINDYNIQLNNVSFKYGDGEPYVLKDVTLRIGTGECVAIVGPSGCGKTTLLKIMLGLLKPTEGEVLIGGVNIEKIGLTNYRNLIGAVMQDDQLLSGTIAENISFFKEDRDLNKIQMCATRSCIARDLEKMPMGYNSLIGDMGSSLSGGQKQRVLIARALYKEPKILFLDEATSHLDVTLEKNINDVLRGFDITRVVIAHRPDAIALADRIISLDNGKVKNNNTVETTKVDPIVKTDFLQSLSFTP